MEGEVSQTLTTVCLKLPPDVNSPGLVSSKSQFLGYALPRLELEIALLFVFSQAFHFLLNRLGVPVFVSQMIAGLVVGALMNSAVISIDGQTAAENNSIVLGSVATLGYSFYMFQNGVKTDLGMVKRAGNIAICIGILSVLMPLIASTVALQWIGGDDKHNIFYKNKGFFLAVTYSLTSFPVVVNLLSHLKILNSELGRLGLSAAIVADLFSLFLFTVNALLKISIVIDSRAAGEDLIVVIPFVLVVVFVVRPAMSWVVRRTPEGRPVKEYYVYVVILVFLISVYLTNYFGQFLLFGPFVLGLAVPNGPPLGSALEEKFDGMASGLFLPLFVASTTMRIDFFSLSDPPADTRVLSKNAIIFSVTLLIKFLSCLLLSLYCNLPKSDALALSLVLSAKGIVEMGWYSFLIDGALMDPSVFKLMTFSIMALAIIVPILVRKLYDPSRKYAGYRKRNIMNSNMTSELPILACIHVPNNVTAVINLLDASSPTRDTPIAVNVLHLIKLSGQATPIFISHQLEKHASSAPSYSENVILSFQQFERKNWGAVTLNAFTAISPPVLMHEDVCTLALDKLACFIILPFHRRWYIDGSIESDDHTIMALNWRIFERAPCSAGVLIDRGHLRRQLSTESSSESAYKIAMIFLGGSDDREGLTFAKRMAQDTRVKLTVLHLHGTRSSGGGGGDRASWDHMLDLEVLKDVKHNGYVRYMEEEVNDGHVTASMLREMVNDYELIIVGRRFDMESPQTSGLKEWSEFPELGILGDLLASSDFHGKCSVLVVQQQVASENMR